MVGRCSVLYLHYKITSGKFYIKEKNVIHIFLHNLFKTYIYYHQWSTVTVLHSFWNPLFMVTQWMKQS